MWRRRSQRTVCPCTVILSTMSLALYALSTVILTSADVFTFDGFSAFVKNSQKCLIQKLKNTTWVNKTMVNIEGCLNPHSITDHSRSFQIIPDHSRSFQIIPDHSRSFQIIPDHSRSFQIIPDHSRSFQIIPDHSRSFQIIPDHSRSFQIIPSY